MASEQPGGSLPGIGPVQRWAFAGTLTLAMAVGPFTIYAVGALAPFVTADLDLTRAQLGIITTLVVIISAFSAPLMGRLVDAIGGRRVGMALFSLTILSLAAASVAPTYSWLLAGLAISGFALAMIDPSTNQLVSVHVPRGRQGLIVGLKQSGVQVGALLAGATLPAGALLLGWRGVLLASALLPVMGLVGLLSVVPADPTHWRGAVTDGPPPRLTAAVPWLAGYAFLMGTALAPASTYLPLYAHERVGLSVTAAGMAAALIAFVAIVGRILWGHQAERIGRAPLPLGILAGVAVAAQAMIWAAEGSGAWLLWAGAVAFGGSAGAWHAVGTLALVREVDVRLAGRAAGLVQMCFYVGFAASPTAFGLSVDATGGYDLGWGAMTLVFAFAGALTMAWHRRSNPALPNRTNAQ